MEKSYKIIVSLGTISSNKILFKYGFFEQLIQKLILQNNNKSIVIVSPEKGKQSKIEFNFSKEMQKIKK